MTYTSNDTDEDIEYANNLIRQDLKNLKIENPDHVLSQLTRVAETYAKNKERDSSSPSLASVLKELEKFQNGIKPGGRLRMKTLSLEATSALTGTFPTSFANLTDPVSRDTVHSISHDTETVVQTVKNQVAHAYHNGKTGLFGIKPAISPDIGIVTKLNLPVGLPATMPLALEGIKQTLNATELAHLNKHIHHTIGCIKEIFKIKANENPTSRTVQRWKSAHADWQLSVDVLNTLLKSGCKPGLTSLERLIADIVFLSEYKFKAVSDDNYEDAHVINGDQIKKSLSFRNQISSLNEAIKHIEPRIFYLEKQNNASCEARRKRLYAKALYPLLDWRRELERRLSGGDYTQRRHTQSLTGDTLELPKWPSVKSSWTISRKTYGLIHASRKFHKNPETIL